MATKHPVATILFNIDFYKRSKLQLIVSTFLQNIVGNTDHNSRVHRKSQTAFIISKGNLRMADLAVISWQYLIT